MGFGKKSETRASRSRKPYRAGLIFTVRKKNDGPGLGRRGADSSLERRYFRQIVNIRSFQNADEPAVIALWENCGLLRPWNDPKRDIQRKQKVQPEMFLVGLLDENLVATVMAGYEGHRGWINYLAVAPEHRKQGLGRIIMAAAEGLLEKADCPKINLQVRGINTAALDFYRKLGYQVDDVVSLGKRLESDDPT